ncbi:efflux RND transporter periplasmic adaptor subunit [Neiella marina]|uniref:Efflux RND transporter periplasmic adaptor subunit n=1 Tax=Neiella holothuriorum TaxID=2870530 RepID=A0ABS7EFJ3_9GAMM|nr:efflux RND transporter periplasmic adaptor subunit [Neiella holothuriorum]MBW8191101.1 efflux RND transporter periplasmic adaptor subunit [Neiella holothuriorum]
MSKLSQGLQLISNKPWILAVAISVLLVLWMTSGSVEQTTDSAPVSEENLLPKVQVLHMEAESVTRAISLYGRTEPNRRATLRAETAGRVVEVMAARGASVKSGEPLVRLAMNDRQQRLSQAKAEFAQREIEYQGAKRLSSQGFSGKARLAEAQAELEQAKAAVARLELEIEHTIIKAPFDGILNERVVEIGDYVGISDPVAMMYDIDPLIIRADAGQHDISLLQLGQQGQARFVNGNIRYGKIRYLSKVADEATNTFRVELALDNADGQLFAGLSTELELPLATVNAIQVTPALLALDEDGNLGIKSVVDDIVVFTPIELVKADNDGVWLSGFGESVDVITLGQGFVRPGDQVIPVYKADQ